MLFHFQISRSQTDLISLLILFFSSRCCSCWVLLFRRA